MTDPRRKSTRTEQFWKAVGGRKMANGYLYAALITLVALRMTEFPFEAYAMYLGLALLSTSAIVALEDKKPGTKYPKRRVSDVDDGEPYSRDAAGGDDA